MLGTSLSSFPNAPGAPSGQRGSGAPTSAFTKTDQVTSPARNKLVFMAGIVGSVASWAELNEYPFAFNEEVLRIGNMIKSLPSRPNLEQLKNQATDLLKALESGHPDAIRRIRENQPREFAAPEPGMNAAELSLADAQLVIAREYGFDSWSKLKEHVDAVALDQGDPMELFKQAFANHDADLFRRLLDRHPALKARINEPVAAFDAPVITGVRTREMLEVLLDAGADINARSRWWAGGF